MSGRRPETPRPDPFREGAERVPDDTPAIPAAGPHAKPGLTNPDATPGAGILPDETADGDADAGSG